MANDPVIDKIITSRVRMLLNAPFFGNLATRLKIIDASGWCPTAGTDGKHFYYNKDFLLGLDKDEMEFLMGHEVMHCVYDHMERRGSRDPQLWNCAGDFVINLDLVESGIGKLIHKPEAKAGTGLAADGTKAIVPCYDKKYAGMSADQIYELLKDEQDQNGGKGEKHQFDVHMDPDGSDGDEDGEGGEGGAGGKYDPTGKNGPIPMTDEEKAVLGDEIRQAMMEAAKVAGAGNCPGGVRRMIKDLTEPQMDWREILNAQVQSCVKNDYTFARPSRKSSGMGGGIILPGQDYDVEVDVDIAVDTSGSMSAAMLNDLLSETKGIMEQFEAFKLRVWCFDTSTYTVHTYTPDNLDEIDYFEMEGGGGTTFECNWAMMREEEIMPNQFIIMTDGYPCGTWGDDDYCDTIFLIHGSKDIEAPFGLTVYYEPPE